MQRGGSPQEQIAGLRQRTMVLEAQKEDLSVRSELGPLLAELRYLEKRVQGAIPIDPATQGGDAIRWRRPVGDLDLEILSFRYGS